MMHRNLIAGGYWNAETRGRARPRERLYCGSAMARPQPIASHTIWRDGNRETASGRFIVPASSFFECIPQMNRVAEGNFARNDLRSGSIFKVSEIRQAHRRIRSVSHWNAAGYLLAVAAFCEEAPPRAASWVLSIVAIITGFALFGSSPALTERLCGS